MRMTRIAVAFLVSIVALAGTTAQDKPEPPPRKYTFGSMGVALRADLTIYQGGGKDAEGKIVVGNGDRLLKFGGKDLKTLDDFCRALYATKPGEEVEVSIERTDAETKEKKTLTAKITLGDPKAAYANLYAHKDKRRRSHDWNKLRPTGASYDRATQEVAAANVEGAWDSLIAAHERELDLWNCYEATTACESLLRQPARAEAFIREATAAAEKMGRQEDWISPLLAPLAHLADQKWAEPAELDLPKFADENAPTPAEFAARTEAALETLDLGSTPDRALFEAVLGAQFAWAGEKGHDECVALVNKIRQSGIDPSRALARLATVLDAMHREARPFWDLAEAGIIERAPKDLDMKTFVEGDAACFKTKFGLVAVGGKGRNVWRGGSSAPVFILDMGGDDEYIDCASTHFMRGQLQADGQHVEGPGSRISLIFDRNGNDRYCSTGKWGVAAGVLGVAGIIDWKGDDTYECAEWGVGAAFVGVGVIVDWDGSDRYLGGRNTIGCAAYGFGAVIDPEDNDMYDSHEYSIGVGHPGGVGIVLDKTGDDRYRCTGKAASGYGTKGEFSGWGIGCGFGWRTLAAGGIGIVVDVAGNDIYDAGEFGLGCGYFLGVGMVRDMAGDDIYHSSRYGLATAAHCAVGLFMDDSGNDVYVGKTAASMAGVWDIAVGYFHEGGGNDVYRCDGLALGASAQNGVGIFWEAGGDDVYQCGDSCLGYGGAAEYAGGRLARNFGLFFDLGGNDTYPGAPKNKSKTWAREHGLFVDE